MLQQTGLWFLNIVARIAPFSDEEEKAESHAQLAADRALTKRGLKAGAATFPAYRRPWVPHQFINLEGAIVPLSDPCHPNRDARTQYGWFEGGEDELEVCAPPLECAPCGNG